jgi:hypothetical protein
VNYGEYYSLIVFDNSTLRLCKTLSVAGQKILRRFFINRSDLSSLHNEHHVVDHQDFLKTIRDKLSQVD